MSANEQFVCPHCRCGVEVSLAPEDRIVDCPECQQQFSVPGTLVNCPDCGHKVSPKAVACPNCGSPFRSAPPVIELPSERTNYGRPIRKGETAGVGCAVELVGLILLFVFPIGTVIGIGVLILGHVLSYRWVCSNCGNKLDSKSVRMCPACRILLK
jgi:DNA-directed RNA polymerase subunit RPC12/RpoP